MVEQRLARIENKVDRLADAVERIARIEERQALSGEGLKRMSRILDSHEQRLARLETAVAVDGVKLGAGERMFWGVLAAVMSLASSGVTWMLVG